MYIWKIFFALICAVTFKADSVAVVLNARKIFTDVAAGLEIRRQG